MELTGVRLYCATARLATQSIKIINLPVLMLFLSIYLFSLMSPERDKVSTDCNNTWLKVQAGFLVGEDGFGWTPRPETPWIILILLSWSHFWLEIYGHQDSWWLWSFRFFTPFHPREAETPKTLFYTEKEWKQTTPNGTCVHAELSQPWPQDCEMTGKVKTK